MSYRQRMEEIVENLRFGIDMKQDVARTTLAHYGPKLIDMGQASDRLADDVERLRAIVDLVELKAERDALLSAAQSALDFFDDDRHGTLNADMLDYDEKRERAGAALRRCLSVGEEPHALTDQHAAALERAIRAEGYSVLVDPETGDVKLERAEAEDHGWCGDDPDPEATAQSVKIDRSPSVFWRNRT